MVLEFSAPVLVSAGGLLLAIITGLARATSSATRRPVQRALDAAALLASLDQVKRSEEEHPPLTPSSDRELRENLSAMVRGNAAAYAVSPAHRPRDDTWRVVFMVEAFIFATGGVLLLTRSLPGSTPAGVLFLALAGASAMGAAQANVRYRRRERAHEVAGLPSPPTYLGLWREVGSLSRLAFRRWRSRRDRT